MNNSNTFVILRGLPSSGKTTLVKQLKEEYYPSLVQDCSTDKYWVRPDGFYDFNANRLGEAHAWCKNEVKNKLLLNIPVIILDNTNTQWWEIKDYVEMALKEGYRIQIKEPNTPWKFDVEKCFKRNTHSVPLETIKRMLDRWESTDSILSKIEEMQHVY